MIEYYEYSVQENEHLYGRGKRLVLFTQGCTIRCKGCINSHLWERGKGKYISADELVKACEENDVEGVTLHGGEPLCQAEELLPFVKRIKDMGLTVILFTGYNKKELSLAQKKVWNFADIVVCGRYDEGKRNCNLQFRGSTNQRVVRRKGKYKDYKVADGKSVSILEVDDEGNLKVKGFLTDAVKELIDFID